MRTAQRIIIMMLVSLVILVSYSFSSTASDAKGIVSPTPTPPADDKEPTPEIKEPQNPPDEPDNPAGPADTPSLNTKPPYYVLTIIIDGNGSVQKNPDQPSYPAGTAIELTAMADPGWYFDHWDGDLGASDNPGTIIMDENKKVTVHFVEDNTLPYTSSTPNPPDAPSGVSSEQKSAQTDLNKIFGNPEYLFTYYFEIGQEGQLLITVFPGPIGSDSLPVQVTTCARIPVPEAKVECQGNSQTTDANGYAILKFTKSGSCTISASTGNQNTPAYCEVITHIKEGKDLGALPLPPAPGGPSGGGAGINIPGGS
jgi:hypothetical protein